MFTVPCELGDLVLKLFMFTVFYRATSRGTLWRGRFHDRVADFAHTRPARATICTSHILALWREEARRCRAGGCIAGGEHVWTDASRTLVRLSVGARCCERCGLLEMSETNQPIVLPNLLGQFGAPVGAELGGAERAWLSEALATGEAEMRRLHASYAPSRESTGVIEAAPFASLDPCARDVPLTSRTGKARFAAHTAYAIRIDHTCSTRLASQSPTSSASASEYAPFAQEVHRFNLPSSFAALLNGRLAEWALGKERQAAHLMAAGGAAGGAAGVQKTNVGGYQSAPDIFEAPYDVSALAEVHELLTIALGEVSTVDNPTTHSSDALDALTGWLNVNRGNDHNALHVHVPDKWSAIYYVDAGPAADDTVAFPDGHLIFRAGAEGRGGNASTHYAVRPVAGTMWLFPGGIPHAVLGFLDGGKGGRQERMPRISLAANYRHAVAPPPRAGLEARYNR